MEFDCKTCEDIGWVFFLDPTNPDHEQKMECPDCTLEY